MAQSFLVILLVRTRAGFFFPKTFLIFILKFSLMVFWLRLHILCLLIAMPFDNNVETDCGKL